MQRSAAGPVVALSNFYPQILHVAMLTKGCDLELCLIVQVWVLSGDAGSNGRQPARHEHSFCPSALPP